MHGRGHKGVMLFGVLFLFFPTFMSVKHLAMGWVISVLASACIILLWQLVSRLLMCRSICVA